MERAIITNVYPQIEGGKFPIKRVTGEKVAVRADIFAEGHQDVKGAVLYRRKSERGWHEAPMRKEGNDRWGASFMIDRQEDYVYTVCAWVDEFAIWQRKISKLWNAGEDFGVDLLAGAELLVDAARRAPAEHAGVLKGLAKDFEDPKLAFYGAYFATGKEITGWMEQYGRRKHLGTYPQEFYVAVDRPKALFSTWYELFPRSWGQRSDGHGTFKDCQRLLPEIARMGFDVLYLPPIHPIGTVNRKGKNNSLATGPENPGSPWAVGAEGGGHKAVHPQLGTLGDFKKLIAEARAYGIELAMDIAFQCSPDHPYVKKHPRWFQWRPDGTIQYAENPPKKYEDIYPISFDTDDYAGLSKELKSVFMYWIKQGIRIFRVDNPHTKPFAFWDWVIAEIRGAYPDVLFLAEAFTRPKVMQRLAKGGFHQSYTYFTWRVSSWEFMDYMRELVHTESREYFRPNFWPNTPDILPSHLQHGGRPAFMQRLVLAATLSSNYGIYGPAYELCVSQAVPGKEEYLNSEKYEILQWDWDAPGNLKDFIARVNQIRRNHPAFQTTWNVDFVPISNPQMLCYTKAVEDLSDILMVVVNMDPHHTQSGWVQVPVEALGFDRQQPYKVHDLLSQEQFSWRGPFNYVELNPHNCPAHIFKLSKG